MILPLTRGRRRRRCPRGAGSQPSRLVAQAPLGNNDELKAYDPVADNWTTKTSLPTGRWQLAGAAINGILYAVGGDNNAGDIFATLEAYDPATDTWTTKASMPTARHSLAGVAINGILYAVGGFNAGYMATLEAYHP